jgi:hypothetical protein
MKATYFYKRKSELTLAADEWRKRNNGNWTVRCKLECEHALYSRRDGFLLLHESAVIRKVIRCNVCLENRMAELKGGTNG